MKYQSDYNGFLEHMIIIADRFKISFSEAVQKALGNEYQVFTQLLEQTGKTMLEVAQDAQNTFIYKNHEQYYRANGISRDWLQLEKLQ